MNAPEVGSVVDHYRLDSVLGRGGTAVVYAATDTRLGRQVAVKVLSPDLAQDVQFRERFTRESRVAASIDHPHIVPLYEAGEWGGHLYIAMRLVDGTDLGTLVRREGRLDPARTVSITSQVASALDEAHHRGLIHRDVKPANVLVVPGQGPGGGDHAYLSDFGLTKPVSSQTQLTRAGLFVGTADYVAPEQIQGAAVDHRVDVYSLGCLVYECLTGRRPFERDNELAVMVAHVSEPAPQVMQTRPEAGFALSRVVARALAKSRDDRFATCGDLAAAARAALDDYVPCLVVRDGLLAGHSIRVDTEVLLGRDDTEHPLLDPAVSRRHALVRRDGRHLGITDLGSRNGTWVNGRRIVGQASLNPGDAVVVGATTIDVGADTRGRASATIALERPAPPAAAASPPPAAPLVWTPAAAAPPATAA
ncbi:MAG TPA: FHA domain-containing serine/threonine-protein kinase, partial [Candidatus Dormibacteraeota bacterium]|nr:FHA domain-containing serine/threonine-protein kinase [Candidatus Dormibacteraeota bacterium]